jgi:hypothetical protein
VRRPRLLLSARDPAGAAQLRAVLPALRASRRFTVRVVASEPALDMLDAAGESPTAFSLPGGASHVAAEADAAPLLAAAARLVRELEPDALLVGVSSLGFGLDEALLAAARDRPTFALQDYPGDASAIGGAYASLYFVRDDAAARLTRARFGAPARPVGSLRHATYATLDVPALRAATRERLAVRDGRAVVGFFAQPAVIPGQRAAFEHLVAALAEVAPDALVVLREHPKSPEEARTRLAVLRAAGLEAYDASLADDVEPWLAACDVVTTCFSHTSIDYAFLSAQCLRPLGAVVFLLSAPATRSFMREAGPATPDGVDAGLGLCADSPAEVPRLLRAALGEEARRAYHAASRRLPARADINAIIRTVAEAAEARRRRVRAPR